MTSNQEKKRRNLKPPLQKEGREHKISLVSFVLCQSFKVWFCNQPCCKIQQSSFSSYIMLIMQRRRLRKVAHCLKKNKKEMVKIWIWILLMKNLKLKIGAFLERRERKWLILSSASMIWNKYFLGKRGMSQLKRFLPQLGYQ